VEHDAWLVDLDGTLYRPLPVKLAMAAELVLAGRRHLPAIRAFRHEHERLRATGHDPVESPFRLQLERAAAATGCSPADLDAIVAEWMVRRPGKWIRRFRRASLLVEIGRFRDAGGRTALVSDYPARAKLDALGVTALFECVVANGEPGGPARLKPWPDGYLRAARELGVEPSRCLVVGDRDDADGEAARRGGMSFRRIG
jgi:FMN phosphatase YigB (HAD superfamily)